MKPCCAVHFSPIPLSPYTSIEGALTMLGTFNRLGPKLILITLTFLLLLAIATSFLVTQGFHQTQGEATRRSVQGLEAQGREALLGLTQREAQISILQFQQAAVAGHHAADYMVSSV